MTRSFSVPAFEFVSPLCLERHGRSLSQRKLSDERHIAALFAAGQRSVQPDAYAGSMKKAAPTLDMTVDQVMTRWPASIRVFMDFKMSCVGCPIATFHSVDEASREHAIDPAAFLSALQRVAA